MRRTTVLLDDDLADRLDYERRRRNQSTTAIVREALTEYLAGGKPRPRRLAFANLGRSGHHDTSERIDEILAREWTVENLTGRAPTKKRTGTARRSR
ncbi:MAG: ribbon-helix-helix protein, CopG family [Chloroflexi bacterium]|nr:MAG: ribbon-helix-helix protein, CopG family [Chloroflexota bacterium]